MSEIRHGYIVCPQNISENKTLMFLDGGDLYLQLQLNLEMMLESFYLLTPL